MIQAVDVANSYQGFEEDRGLPPPTIVVLKRKQQKSELSKHW